MSNKISKYELNKGDKLKMRAEALLRQAKDKWVEGRTILEGANSYSEVRRATDMLTNVAFASHLLNALLSEREVIWELHARETEREGLQEGVPSLNRVTTPSNWLSGYHRYDPALGERRSWVEIMRDIDRGIIQ